MNRKPFLPYWLTIAALLLLNVGGAGATPESRFTHASSPVGTAFTYQGQLTSAGAPVNSLCEMTFKLFDEAGTGVPPTGGVQIGSGLTQTISVTVGLFTTELDFGPGVFNGQARWLEIATRCPAGSGVFGTLSPRQKLNPSPYAIYAQTAPWNGLSGVPAGFVDGIDNTSALTTTVVVSPVGTQAQNGAALLAVLASLTGTASTPYVIKLEPGIYDLGASSLAMKSFVDIEGSGEARTKITAQGSTSPNTAGSSGTVQMLVSNTELRFLTVENTGGNFFAVGVYMNSAQVSKLTNVTINASGATTSAIGVSNVSSTPNIVNAAVFATASGNATAVGVINNNSPTRMMNVTIQASNGLTATAVQNSFSSSRPILNNVTARASGATGANIAIHNVSGAAPTLMSSLAVASGGNVAYGISSNTGTALMMALNVTVSGGKINYGVYNVSTSPQMTDMAIGVTGTGGNETYGVFNSLSSPAMNGVSIVASGAITNNFGVYNSTASPTIKNASITASGGLVATGVHNSVSSAALVDSLITASGGTIYNYGVYNQPSTSVASPSRPTLTNLTINVSGGNNTTYNYGVLNNIPSTGALTTTIVNSVIAVSAIGTGVAPSSAALGVAATSTSGGCMVKINGSRLSITSGAFMDAIYNLGKCNIKVGASQSDSANGSGFMDETGAGNEGTIACIYVYKQDYTAHNNTANGTTCPPGSLLFIPMPSFAPVDELSLLEEISPAAETELSEGGGNE